MLIPSNPDVNTIYMYCRCYRHSDGITIGEKWSTALPSKIDGDFFYSVEAKGQVCHVGAHFKAIAIGVLLPASNLGCILFVF